MSRELARPGRPPLPRPEPIRAGAVEWRAQGPLLCLDREGAEELLRALADTARWVQEADWRLRYHAGALEGKDGQDSAPE